MFVKMQGWIKLHRQLTEWEWYTDLKIKAVWLHLLLTANYTQGKRYCGFELAPGQVVTTIARLSAETGLTTKETRRALDRLEESGEISRKGANKFTLITIEKWAFYQSDTPDEGKQKASKGQTEGKQRASVKKEYKKYNNLIIPLGSGGQAVKPKNKFANYQQSDWDFEKIEEQERRLRKQREM